MKVYRHYQELPTEARGAAVAIGNFDGVHRGHQRVIGEAGRIARAAGVPWGVLTFEPHPRSVFEPHLPPFRLTPFRIKMRQIEALGVDFVVCLHFDAEFAARAAETFVDEVLVTGLAARHVVSGYDFVFGHGRRGNCEMLLDMGGACDFGFTCVQPVKDEGGVPFSSTRVREALIGGDPEAAAAVLGRFFEVEGRVEHGDKRGRAIGFPTANIPLGEYLMPKGGVYAVRAGVDLGGETAWRDGVANLGNRPSFEDRGVLLETHLFDTSEDLYGRHLRVQLLGRIRDEQRFAGLEALKSQIALDAALARQILARHPSIC